MPTRVKSDTIEQFRARLVDARAAVLTEYRGLTVQQLSELRKQLRAASGEYRVIKNRLARIAVEGSVFAGLRPHLKGPTGVVLARRDPVAVAKTLTAFVRTTPALQVKASVVEGQLLEPQDLRAVAELPSADALRAQLVGLIQGPLAGLVGLLQAPMRELAYVLAERGKGAAVAPVEVPGSAPE